MRKLWMGFAACALILSSCNKQEVFENIDQNNSQLQFSMAMGTQTRAAELTNTGLKATGGAITNNDKAIKLYAYQELSSGTWSEWYTSNLWWAALVEQWNINSVHFANVVPTKYYSYYPQTGVTYNPETGNIIPGTTPKLTYTASTTAADQVDLVGGVTSVTANSTQVQIKMRHLLSQINFGVYGYKGANIEIGAIIIKGVKNGGTYTFKGSDDYPLGTWGTYTPAGTANYSYTKGDNIVPADATTGHKYIFGDGGKWAVGPNSTSVWYWHAGKSGGPGWSNPANITDVKLSNSLMLIPQDLTEATVEFQYRISDVNNGYTAGSATGWADGAFSLNFKTGGTSGIDYLGKWEENFRYVYMIDFTDWLDGRVQTFSVDVDSQPWENYNNSGADDGIVDIAVLGQTTLVSINRLAKGSTYYMASQSTTLPTVDQIAQLITDATWDWTSYDFEKLTATGDNIKLDFRNVTFNSKTLTINVPAGFKVYKGAEADQQSVTVNAATDVITISRVARVTHPTATNLNGLATTNTWYITSGGTTDNAIENAHITANATWDWSNGATYTFAGLTAAGESINLNFNKVKFNGKKIAIKVPAGFTIYASTIGEAANQQAMTIDVTTPIAVTIAKAATMVAPTFENLNALADGVGWHVAKTDGTNPGITTYVHLTANVAWDWSNGATYTFAALMTGQTASLNFKNVNFNGKTISLKVPAGVTLSTTLISSATTVTITNKALYNTGAALKTDIEAETGPKTFYFTGDGSAINLASYTMNATNSAVITVVFYGNAPATTPNGSNWTWNAAIKTATYTAP